MLQEQTQQLAITLAAVNQALAESVKLLNARMDEDTNAMRKGFADQKLLIDNMASDVSRIRERSNDTNVRIGSLQEELEALRTTVQALQQTAVAPPASVVDPLAPAGTGTSTPAGAAPASGRTSIHRRTVADAPVRNRPGRLLRRPMEQRDQRVRGIPPGISPIRAGR